jgi:alpha-beta hydrolase superfamily lysophospholipase
MQLLLLGGYSTRNKPWIHEVGDALAPLVERCVVHEYAHWSGEGQDMDFAAELAAIAEEAEHLDDYVVFAKSIGIVLTVEAMSRGLLAPRICVFAGLPLSTAVVERGQAFARQLARLQCPLVFVQNNADPLGSYEAVKQYLERAGATQAMTVELPGDTHHYGDVGKLRTVVRGAMQAA